jgi:hypothetical protein
MLTTCFARAACYLNNRPIAYSVGTENDLEPITPNHFLSSGIHTDLAPVSMLKGKSLAERYRSYSELLDKFWSRFVNEKVTSLRHYKKWSKIQPNVQVGDVVMVLTEAERGRYPLGRIESVKENLDGLVRSVKVRTKVVGTGSKTVPLRMQTLERGIHHIYVILPSETELSEDGMEPGTKPLVASRESLRQKTKTRNQIFYVNSE